MYFLVLTLFFAIGNCEDPSFDEFNRGVTSNGFPRPTYAQYLGYKRSLTLAFISRKLEAAMYLAQILHESGGLMKKREDGCSGEDGCMSKYPPNSEWLAECHGSSRPGGKGYYGRGYIQLTWCSNYVPASKAIFDDGNRLKWDPDAIAKSDELSWQVSGWYWGDRVHYYVKDSDQFGLTTKAINGYREECQGNGKNADKSRQRFAYYMRVFYAFGLPGQPNAAGCRY